MSLDGGRHIVDIVDDVVLHKHVAAAEIHLNTIAIAGGSVEDATPDVADTIAKHLHTSDVADLDTVSTAADEIEVLDGHVRDGLKDPSVHRDPQITAGGGVCLAPDGEHPVPLIRVELQVIAQLADRELLHPVECTVEEKESDIRVFRGCVSAVVSLD